VTIRLLDPPLHEFLPSTDKEADEIAKRIGRDPADLKNKVRALHEFNPMLGHRGCRLAITYPEIYQMQVRAIAQAMAQLLKEKKDPQVEIMIPLVMEKMELQRLRKVTEIEIQTVEKETGIKIPAPIGTM